MTIGDVTRICDSIMDWFYDNISILIVLIGVALLCLGVVGVFGLFQPTFSLAKADWTCTRSHEETTTMIINNVVTASSGTVCDQWTRKGR